MKKVFLFVALCLVCTTISAQEFDKGDRRLDFSIGVGMIDGNGKSTTSFDQHFGMEWGVGRIANKVTVGLGFSINNTYAPGDKIKIAGTYDYYYNRYVNSAVMDYNKWDKIHREGAGTADAKISREDINALLTVSFHYYPLPKLGVYTRIGVGVGVMNYIMGATSNEEGFESKNVDKTVDTGSRYVYSYNDLDHVKWETPLKSKIVPALAAYVGVTYRLNDRWGVDAQVGLLSANIKDKDKGYPNSYSVFAIGASYKF